MSVHLCGHEQINQDQDDGQMRREDWMNEGDGIVDGAAKELSRKLMAEWVLDVYKSIPCQMQGMCR